MQGHDPSPGFWSIVFEVLFGGHRRRIESLEAENKKLAEEIRELRLKVARHNGELTVLARVLPPAARLLAESGAFSKRDDPPTTH